MAKVQATPRRDAALPDERLELGVLRELVGFHVRLAQVAVYQDFMLGQPGPALTPGLFAILVLIDQNAGMTQQRLCQGIGVDKSTLVVTLHRLEERGLIRRVKSTADRRENSLTLTAKGKTTLRAMTEHVRAHEQRVTRSLSKPECAQLVSLLRRMG